MSKLRTHRVPRICSASRVCCSFTSFASSTSLFFSRHSSLATRHFLLAAILLLLSTRSAVALDPSLDISQYAHTSWKVRDGFTKGAIFAIAQTADGYLWLGTESGLVRFDGVRAVPWQPPAGEQLPSNFVQQLLASRDGTLWKGTHKVLANWKDGKFTQYSEFDGLSMTALVEDQAGTVWVGAFGSTTDNFCAAKGNKIDCYSGDFGRGLSALYQDHSGNLWVAADTGLWHWSAGAPEKYAFPPGVHYANWLAEDESGRLLLSTDGGLKQLSGGKIESYFLPGVAGQFTPTTLLRTVDGSLWVGNQQGLLHMHQGRTDAFKGIDGLSADFVSPIFEDREGNVWVGTQDGLDRFRDVAAPTISLKQGLSSSAAWSVLAAPDQSVWIATAAGLNRWQDGTVTVYRSLKALESLGQDKWGRLWTATRDGLFYFEKGRLLRVPGVHGGTKEALVSDADGNIWISSIEAGLLQVTSDFRVNRIPWSQFGHSYSYALLPDVSRGGLWLGFTDGGIIFFKNGRVDASYKPSDGLGKGIVSDIGFDSRGVLWAATEGGLSRIKDGHITTLTSKNGLPCDAVHWFMEDQDHAFWLYKPCGLLRIAASEIEAWLDDASRVVQFTILGVADGVRTPEIPGGFQPIVTKSHDGRIWFLPRDGVSVLDPRHLPYNKIPPPVHIEQIMAGGKVYDSSAVGSGALRLPARIGTLDIDYTALSLVVPEKVRFRVKLEGQDKDWRELVNVRHVEYTNLAPKTYRFLVKACNNSGVWNEEGAALAFTIPPMWYQTNWFLALCVAAFLVLFWALYHLRLHQLAAQFNMRLEARVGERTRIARDLHDTLLQSFHGILLRMQILSNELPDGNTKEKLGTVIDEAEHAIVEGRDAVQGLRASTVERNDLAAAIRTLGEELAPAGSSSQRPEFSVQMEGAPRKLHPILRDEVYRIAGEAMRNAFRHADAQRIEVEIRYDERQLRVRVRDDGKGVDLKLMGDNGREGHFGLRGMRERAKLIGGKLTVWSELDSGTEVELTIPAARAYVTAPEPRRSRLVEKLAGKLKGKDTELRS